MSLLTLVLVVLAAGVVVYFIHQAAWIAPLYKKLASGLIFFVIVLLLLNAVGVIDALSSLKVPRFGK